MTKISLAVMSAALAIGMATSAVAGVDDPEILVYRFPGVFDDGSASGAGFATMFNCTNFSGANENIRFVTRNFNSSIMGNALVTIPHLNSRRAFTHAAAFLGGQIISLGSVDGGTTAVAATSTNIICTAATIDAANPSGDGVSLRGIRFNPAPGSQE